MTEYTDQAYLQTFRNYVALKLHFDERSTYDFKPDSLGRLSVETMLKRKDLHFFAQLTQMYNGNEKEIYEHLLTCFLANPTMWIGDMLVKKYQKQTQTRLDSIKVIHYNVVSLFDSVSAFTDDVKSVFICSKNDRPSVIKLHGNTHDEVFACIDTVNSFTQQDTCNPLWYARKSRIHSYAKLLDFNHETVLYCKDKLGVLC